MTLKSSPLKTDFHQKLTYTQKALLNTLAMHQRRRR